jgi:hypothetical protein
MSLLSPPLMHVSAHPVALNFMVIGEVRSGASIVQTSLNRLPEVVCHGDLMHPDDVVRRQTHEDYFGAAVISDRLPEWCKLGEVNPYRYLNDIVFDNPKKSEKAIGIRLDYDTVDAYDLYEMINERWREGDFCVIHVRRNPIACYVSLIQAKRSKVWGLSVNDKLQAMAPPPVRVDADELLLFCRQHEQRHRRLINSCGDICTVQYQDLVFNFGNTMRQVLKFLELSTVYLPTSTYRRLRNNELTKRIVNYDELRLTAPKEIRDLLIAPDCF